MLQVNRSLTPGGEVMALERSAVIYGATLPGWSGGENRGGKQLARARVLYPSVPWDLIQSH